MSNPPSDIAPLDVHAFSAQLWNPSPPVVKAAPKVAPPPPQPSPLRVELVAIIFDSGIRKAALYDIDTDQLLIVCGGDHLHGYNVTAVSDKEIQLSDGQSRRTLALKEPGS